MTIASDKTIRYSILFLICGLLMGAYNSLAQGKGERDKNWKPEEGKYYFSEAWVWSYNDEFSDSRGEFTVYVDTLSGIFLFNHDSYGASDEQADFVIATQDGIYIAGITDENGKKILRTDTLSISIDMHNSKKFYDEDFQKITKPTGEFKTYGQNSQKWPTIRGEKFRTTFEMPVSYSDNYLVKKNFSLLPIYNFNQPHVKPRLPYNFSLAIHMNYLLLETFYESDGKRISIMLKNITPAKQLIDLAAYKN